MHCRHITVSLFLCLLLTPLGTVEVCAQIDFPSGSSFSYLKGKDAAGLNSDWMNSGFDDTGWRTGNSPIRYGDGTGGTVLDDMQYNYSVVYMRTTFSASHVDSLESLLLTIDYDDGFVIWINGNRVLSRLAPTVLSHNGFATDNHESGQPESIIMDPNQAFLVEGENILAIQGFNISLESSDFLFDIGIHAEVIEPILYDSAGLWFSTPAGFYDSTFYLEVAASDPAWKVRYTLDGSNPQISETAYVAEDTARILVDPGSAVGRARTPCFMVRASAAVDGIKPSLPESRTYIYLDKVLDQTYPGGDWPVQNINKQVIDLVMDGRIVNHSIYGNQMIPALTDISSISVITGLDNLFNPYSGIYVNAEGHGHDWERACSVELLHPDGSDGFNVNAGLRIRGGWSRHPDFPKHSFRLFFRSDYGDAKLYFPLFGTEGVDTFDKIDLRTSQNYAWAQGDGHNTMLRDLFSRDTQRDMGQPYTRSRFYHLYLDGMYWGLFQTQERSEARYAADYFGGKTRDYDVIKVDTEDYTYQIEVTDGNIDSWYTLWDMCKAGFSSNTDYFALEGKDVLGNPVPGDQVYLDLDNLIDYMLSIFYTGNFDAPTSTFRWNKDPNNFYAIQNREDRSSGFTFYNHDAEHSMFSEVLDPGAGLYEDRVNLTGRTDGKHMEVDHFGSFHPQWLHHKLTSNAEYRVRFMDRAHKHLKGEGALSISKSKERLNKRAAEIEMAIIAESARWGDARDWVFTPFTKNSNWLPEVNKIREDFINYRPNILIGQLDYAGLYSRLEATVFSSEGTILHEPGYIINGTFPLRLENKNNKGILYYTTNGTDPRKVGGIISDKAYSIIMPQLDLNISSTVVFKTRVYYDGAWSALEEIALLSENEDYSKLAVTEIHYHPEDLIFQGDTVSGKDLEFIEFKNTGMNAINLSGLVLDSAVYYEFPDGHVLTPGEFYVVASKPSDFYLRYGMIASGNYKKNLSNGGEEVLLLDQEGNPVIHFIYSDDAPWPAEADGEGFSLVSVEYDPTGNPDESDYWKASNFSHGSPFRNDPFALSDNVMLSEDSGIEIYPNPTSGPLNIRFQETGTDNQGDFLLFGINGNLIHRAKLNGSAPIQLEGLNLTSGIYIVKIITGNQIFTRKIIFSYE